MNYYNEFDPKAAAWLRELIREGHIPTGDVDERSITDVDARELIPYTQCHFFAGIGGWSLALRLAGWPEDRPVWTGSCPCQPFSTAGKQKAQQDERHLWPVFASLIRERRPDAIFGEQVASAIGHGWLDDLCRDMETEGYSCGAVVLGAHSVGAPHIRQRLYWVADNKRRGCCTKRIVTGLDGVCGDASNVPMSVTERGACGGLADNNNTGLQRWNGGELSERTSQCPPWAHSAFIPCRDGRSRRIPLEPAFFPLADGIPARVGRLRGYGNAIVPQVAAEFIRAYMDTKWIT